MRNGCFLTFCTFGNCLVPKTVPHEAYEPNFTALGFSSGLKLTNKLLSRRIQIFRLSSQIKEFGQMTSTIDYKMLAICQFTENIYATMQVGYTRVNGTCCRQPSTLCHTAKSLPIVLRCCVKNQNAKLNMLNTDTGT